MVTRSISKGLWAFVATAAMMLASCGGSGSGGTGILNLSITDTPVDGATSVLITFTGVEVQPGGQDDQGDDGQGDDDNTAAPGSSTQSGASGTGNGDDDNQGDEDNTPAPGSSTQSGASGTGMGDDGGDQGQQSDDGMSGDAKPLVFNFTAPMTIDLLKQQGGNSASLLNGVSLPAGHYAWIRLILAQSNCCSITLSDGSVHPLVVPSGEESGLKLVHGFTVAAGGTVNFTIDFDLRESIVLANGRYFLKPVLRIMDNEATGQIRGMVDNTLTIGSTAITASGCMPAAYIYAGDNVTPVDINPTSSVQPVTTAGITLDTDTGIYVYRAGFLAPGDYTVALTCAANDNPAAVDSLTFTTPKNATVTAGMTTEVDFP